MNWQRWQKIPPQPAPQSAVQSQKHTPHLLEETPKLTTSRRLERWPWVSGLSVLAELEGKPWKNVSSKYLCHTVSFLALLLALAFLGSRGF